MTVAREDLLVALDGLIGSALALRKLIEQPGELDEDQPPLEDWQQPCEDREGRPHLVVWVAAGTFGQDGVEQGVCRACGAEFERPDPTHNVGVSGDEEPPPRP